MLVQSLDVFALQTRRERALAHPLHEGDILSPSGPALDFAAVTPLPSSLTAADAAVAAESPNPYRPANLDLRDLVIQPGGWRRLSFRLVKGICVGEDSWAQVWRVEVLQEGRMIGTAVLKLLVEALFWQRWPTGVWQPASEAEEAELRAYTAFRPVQGRDVPHCYGAFSFTMPWGETVTGVVLEDLTSGGDVIYGHCEDEQAAGRYKKVEEVDELISTLYHTIHRLQRLGITGFALRPGDVLVFPSSSCERLRLVILDFGATTTAQEYSKRHAQLEKRVGGMGPWQSEDEIRIEALFQGLLPHAGLKWHEMELRRDREKLHMYWRTSSRQETEL
ncbi:hypothetical protein JCM6882_008361 [Rhodosporidiobolus microsporus]